MKNKYQEALQNLYDMRSKLIDVSSKNAQWVNNIEKYDFIGEQLSTLQELVDKETPTFDNSCNAIFDENLLYELKQIWNEEEWCKGVPLSASGLNSMFNYNLDLFNKNLELDKKNLDLEKELDIFKSAFYTLWKCCNSSECLTDDNKEDKIYVEFKVGFENLFVAITKQELESIKKACEILDICLKEEVDL